MKILNKKINFKQSLKYQLIIVLLFVSVIPLIIAGIITYQKTITQVETEKRNTLIAYAEGIKNNVDIQMKSADNSLKLIQAHSDILVVLENFNHNVDMVVISRLNSILLTLKNMIKDSNGLYETVYITDMNGKIIADGSEYRNIYRDTMYPDMDNFKILTTSKDFLVGKPFYSEATGRLLLPISRPIRSLSSFMGTVTILFDLEKFNETFKLISYGKTGSVYITDTNTLFLYHTNPELVNSINEINMNIEEDTIFTIIDTNGIKKATAYSRSLKTNWIIGVDIDYKEFIEASVEFKVFILLMIIIIIMVVLTLSIIYSKTLTRPISKLINGIRQIEKGNLNVEINYEAVDEFNDLKYGIMEMVKNLKELIFEITDASTSLGNSSKHLIASSQNALAATNESVDLIESISIGANQQVEDMREASSNIEQLACRIESVKENSDEMKFMSQVMHSLIGEGMKCVNILKIKSDQNYKTTVLVSNVIEVLNNEIEKVEKIANTITNIASSTNLLSLNARIEASRAGDFGAGFGVVANEINNLAEQSALEAKEINEIIKRIQLKSFDAVNSIRNVISTAGDQNIAVEDTKSSFESIYKEVADITTKIDKTVLTLEYMDEEKNNIVQSILQIKSVSEKAAISSNNVKDVAFNQMNIMMEVTNCADDLNTLAESLHGHVKKFKL